MRHRTIFDTPVVNTLLRSLSMALLRLGGWKVEGSLPPQAAKSVLIAAPHTSNWDLPYTLMLAFVLNLRVYWMGKQSIFRAPFGGLMRWLGGIPVNRSQANNLVASSAQAMRDAQGPMQLIVPPEGTRGPECMTTVGEQKSKNTRLHTGIDKNSFVAQRKADDTGKDVPALLLPSIQANMRTGRFGAAVNGIQYVKLPVNKL